MGTDLEVLGEGADLVGSEAIGRSKLAVFRGDIKSALEAVFLEQIGEFEIQNVSVVPAGRDDGVGHEATAKLFSMARAVASQL
jgi:hypothetical protein